jgi:hypothetical protein
MRPFGIAATLHISRPKTQQFLANAQRVAAAGGWGPGGQHNKANLGLASALSLAFMTPRIWKGAGGGVDARHSRTASYCGIALELFRDAISVKVRLVTKGFFQWTNGLVFGEDL